MIKSISDWENDNNYIYSQDTSMQRWAFEFLRRNHDYQKDVQDYLVVCDSVIVGFDPFSPPLVDNEQLNKYYDQLDEKARIYEPPMKEGETESEWIDRFVSKGISVKSKPLKIWYAEKWGLQDLFDPYSEFNFLNVKFLNILPRVTIAGSGWFDSEKIKLVSAHEKQAFVIDYNLPLLPQLAAIKGYVLRHKKKLIKECDLKPMPNSRNRSKLFKMYLRCLDADDVGIKKSEIAKKLCPHKDISYPNASGIKTIDDWLKAAKRLRDHNYIYLPLIK